MGNIILYLGLKISKIIFNGDARPWGFTNLTRFYVFSLAQTLEIQSHKTVGPSESLY